MIGWEDRIDELDVNWNAKFQLPDDVRAGVEASAAERRAELEWRADVTARLGELEDAAARNADMQQKTTYKGWAVAFLIAVVGGAVGGFVANVLSALTGV